MTNVDPNPYSPYATADPNARHVLDILLPVGVKTGRLSLTACGNLAVVPEELTSLKETDTIPKGMCKPCLEVAVNGQEVEMREMTPCIECQTMTEHGGICAVCRMEGHDNWKEETKNDGAAEG